MYVLIAALGLVVTWWLGTESGPVTPGSRILYDVKPEAVTYLKLVNSKGTVALEKDGDRWIVTEPVRTLADANSVGPLLQQLATAEHRREIPVGTLKPGSLESWNLEPPAIRVTFRAAGKTHELLLGRDVAANNLAYARSSGASQEPVRLVSLDLKRAMETGLADLRSRTLFDFNAALTTTAGVRILNASGQVERESEINVSAVRGWMLQKPVQVRADVNKVRNWLKLMLGLTAVDFVTDTSPNPSTYGLSSPSAHIWVVLSPQTPSGLPDPTAKVGTTEHALEIGSAVPDKPNLVYAWKPGTTSVFTISLNSVEQLLHGLGDVRDRRLFPFAANDIRRLTVQKGGDSFTLTANKETGWDLKSGDNTWRADKAVVDKMIRRILSEQAEKFVKDTTTDLATYGFDAPQGKLSFVLQNEKVASAFELMFGKVDKGQIFVRNSFEPAVVSTSDVFFEGIPSNALALRHPQAIALNRDRFVSLQVRKKSGSYEMKRVDGKLVCDVPNVPVDIVRAEELAEVITQLRGAQWVGLAKPEYGLDTPDIVATVAAEGDATNPGVKKAVLRVGSGTLPGGMHYAQVEGDPYVFALAGEDFALLDAPPVTTSAKAPAPGDGPSAGGNTNAPPTPAVPRRAPGDVPGNVPGDIPGDVPAGGDN